MGERSPIRGAELHRLENLFTDMLEHHSRLISPERRQQTRQCWETTPSPHVFTDPTPFASNSPPPSALQRLKEQRIKAHQITAVTSAPIDVIPTKEIEIEDINTIKALKHKNTGMPLSNTLFPSHRRPPPVEDNTVKANYGSRVLPPPPQSARLAPQDTPLSTPSSSTTTITTKPFLKRKSKSVVPSTLPKLDWSTVHSKIDTHRDNNTTESKISTSRNGSAHTTPRDILPVVYNNNNVAGDVVRAPQQQQATTRHVQPSSKQQQHQHCHQAESYVSLSNNNNNDDRGIHMQEETGPLDELLHKVDSLLLQLNKAQHMRQ